MSAFTETLYQEFHSTLEFFILKKVKDKDTAKDILQDVFIKIHLHLHTIKDKKKLSAWIYQLTRNTIYDYFRRHQTTNRLLAIPIDIGEENVQTEEGLETCIMPFISQLPEKYREALILTDIHGMSQTQLSNQLNITYSAAKSRVQRARQKLKALFTACCSIHTDKYGNVLSYDKIECGTNCI